MVKGAMQNYSSIEEAGGIVVEADTNGIIVRTGDPKSVLKAAQAAIPEPFKLELEETHQRVSLNGNQG